MQLRSAEVKSVAPVDKGAPGASLYVPFKLMQRQEKTIRLHDAWYTPDSDLTFGKMGERKEECDPDTGCCNSPSDIGLDKYDKDFRRKIL